MTRPTTPSSESLGYDDEDRRLPHTHPVPLFLKVALVLFSIALLASGCAVLYTLARVATVVQEQADATLARCLTDRATAANNRDFYGALLGRLGPNADSVFREQLERQVKTSTKNATRVCGPMKERP